jgi:hypothetical protein
MVAVLFVCFFAAEGAKREMARARGVFVVCSEKGERLGEGEMNGRQINVGVL